MKENLYCEAKINNMPEYHGHGYLVARAVDAELWYYGIYTTEDRAREVAIEIGNGVILSI